MNKKIPKVFANKVNTKGNNNDVFYSYENNIKKEEKNINQKINEIFNSSNYVYKAEVIIKTKNETINKKIIGRNKNYLITMDNKLIPISDIIDIKNKN